MLVDIFNVMKLTNMLYVHPIERSCSETHPNDPRDNSTALTSIFAPKKTKYKSCLVEPLEIRAGRYKQ